MAAGNPHVTAEDVAHLKALYGLDQPLPVRYWHWLSSALQLDFGNRGGSDLAEMFDLVRGPVSRLDIYGDDHRQRFSGSAGDAKAKKPGDA